MAITILFIMINNIKRITLFVTLIFSLKSNASKDSLARSINSLPNDTTKVNTLFKLAMDLRQKDSTTSATCARYMVLLSEKLQFIKGKGLAYYAMGRLAHDYNKHEEAIIQLERGITLLGKSNYPEGVMKCYYWIARCYRRIADYPNYEKYLALLEQQAISLKNNEYLSYAYEGYGNLYRYIGSYPQSIEYYMKAIELSEKLGNLSDVSMALNNMSLVYDYQGKLQEALTVQLRDYSILERLGEKRNMVLCLSNLSGTYQELGQNEKAKEYINKAMVIIKEIGAKNIHFKEVASAYSRFAFIAIDEKKYATALEYFNKEFKLREDNRDIKGVCDSYGHLADVYILMNNKARAMECLLKQLSIANKIRYMNGQMYANKSLADLYLKLNDYKAAYSYINQYTLLKDSIVNDASAKQMAEVEARMKVKDQQQQIKLLSKDKAMQTFELERRNSILYTLVISFLFILLLAFIVIYGYRQKNQINKTIAMQRNKDLKNFIYRSSHDLRSPLTTIKGLINIARIEVSDSEATLDYLSKISGVVDKQDLMLEGLLKVSGIIEGKLKLEYINLEILFSEVMENIKQTDYAMEVDTTEIVQEGLEIKTDRLLLKSIVENLASNAVKYRRRQQEKSFVKLEAFEHNNGVLIKVSDNGEGIADDWKEKVFDLFTRASTEVNGFGLGLYIVRNSAELLGGRVSVASELKKGSVFSVWLPDNYELMNAN